MIESRVNPLQTEYEFTLPRGYLDSTGKLQCDGKMRLATAMDEIAPLRDPRVKNNQAYLTILILSRVITKLGDLNQVTTDVLENMFTADLAFLQDLYRTINGDGDNHVTVTCPNCEHSFTVETHEPGGS